MRKSFFILPDGAAWKNPLFVSRDGKVESVTPNQAHAAHDLLAAVQAFCDDLGDAGYCEMCDSHAPKRPVTGELTGPVPHKEGCALGMAERAIAKAKGETNGREG